MAYRLAAFARIGLDEALLEHLLHEHTQQTLPRLQRLWRYYRNPVEHVEVRTSAGPALQWRQAQEEGLPARLTDRTLGEPKEIVIENDIGWRIETLVDYTVGRELTLVGRTEEPARREQLERIAECVLRSAGGAQWLHETALLASVYGQVEIVVRTEEFFAAAETLRIHNRAMADGAPSNPLTLEQVCDLASKIQLETVAAPRAIALLNPDDCRTFDACILHFERRLNDVEPGGVLKRVGRWWRGGGEMVSKRRRETITEILSADRRQVYADGELVYEALNPLGVVPVVHIQNTPQPGCSAGLSDVEPLIPLQDELNTRLSDRANRVTLQSFKMYLGKGIDGFLERKISPGQMWLSENPDASIEEFGGDASSPSEEAHIAEIRAAMDKTSAVAPLAAGQIQAKVGNLSSENALRISLLGILSKVERKRRMLARGLGDAVALAFAALDRAGVWRSEEAERQVELVWGPPIPEDQGKRLEEAVIKQQLGVPRDRILAELGYDDVERRVL